MKEFKELAVADFLGNVPMSELFEIAFEQIYGDLKTDPFISCTIDNEHCNFQTHDKDGNEYKLTISDKWVIDFWCNDIPLHINQFPLYKKLTELNFIEWN